MGRAESPGKSRQTRYQICSGARRFDDVFALDYVDPDSEPGEVRFVIAGMVSGVLLHVVYTERSSRVRIISARKATTNEQREYYRSQTAE